MPILEWHIGKESSICFDTYKAQVGKASATRVVHRQQCGDTVMHPISPALTPIAPEHVSFSCRQIGRLACIASRWEMLRSAHARASTWPCPWLHKRQASFGPCSSRCKDHQLSLGQFASTSRASQLWTSSITQSIIKADPLLWKIPLHLI